MGTSWIAKGRIWRSRKIDITIWVRFHPPRSPLVWVLSVQCSGLYGFYQERCPSRIQPRESVLELFSGKVIVASNTSQSTQVSVEFEGWKIRMSYAMEGIDVLSNDAANYSHITQVLDRIVCCIWFCLVTLSSAWQIVTLRRDSNMLVNNTLCKFVQPKKLLAQYLFLAS